MNEKLNELRLDAGIARIENQQWLCVLDKETGMMIDPMIGLEKFAELIVGECLGCCEQVISDPVPESVDTWLNGGTQCMAEIKQHFGVEE